MSVRRRSKMLNKPIDVTVFVPPALSDGTIPNGTPSNANASGAPAFQRHLSVPVTALELGGAGAGPGSRLDRRLSTGSPNSAATSAANSAANAHAANSGGNANNAHLLGNTSTGTDSSGVPPKHP